MKFYDSKKIHKDNGFANFFVTNFKMHICIVYRRESNR